jgi:Fe-S cluster biogenesis protein NfuA
MSMGIERVLKENFVGFKEVIEVIDPAQAGPTQLTMKDVQEEFDRLYPAIIAMGSVSKILSVDSDLGVVTMQFRGSNKVRQGLELAILDLKFVNRVEFVMGEDD